MSAKNSAITTLVSAVEMSARFATIVSLETIAREKRFYDGLLVLAGKTVSSQQLALLFTLVLAYRPAPTMINVSDHLEAMVGTRENQVFREANQVFENIAYRSATTI